MRAIGVGAVPDAPVGPRRPVSPSRTVAGDGRRLARLVEQCHPGRGVAGYTRPRSVGLSVRERYVCGASGANSRSHAPSPKIGTPFQVTQTTIIGSCPRNRLQDQNGVPVANAAVAVNKPVELLYAVDGTTDNFADNSVVAQFYSHFYGPNNPDRAGNQGHYHAGPTQLRLLAATAPQSSRAWRTGLSRTL